MVTRFCVLAAALALNLVDLAPGQNVAVEDVPQAITGATVGGPVAPDGVEVQIDLPKALHIRNVGGSDGAGLCVNTSLNHSAYWQNLEPLFSLQQWSRKYPGGSYPAKVKKQVEQICSQQGVPVPRYLQIESKDIEILKTACKTGRPCGVTYSFSPSGRYGGARIAHMVSLLHADDRWFCVLDNNFPGTYEWMTPAEFRRAYTGGNGNGWAVIFLPPGPPPSPKN